MLLLKIELIIDEQLEDEVVSIRCREYTEDIRKIHAILQQYENQNRKIMGVHRDVEYYLDLRNIMFFETLDEEVFAHTGQHEFLVKQRLYELEKIVPHYFMRISKSTILNINFLYAIEVTLGGPHKISLQQTNKKVYVSRKYYPLLKEKLKERL